MALSQTIDWEVRTAGDATNGGAFNRDSSGTDYSQQDSAQLSLTDCATSGINSTTLTSATGGFTAAMVGNVINLSSGTNLTTGFYEITAFTDANTVTIDRKPDDGVGGVAGATGKVGGALSWPPAPSNAGGPSISYHKVWIKHGTYTLTNTNRGTQNGPVYFLNASVEGYENIRGDKGSKPVFSAGNQIPSVSTTIFETGTNVNATDITNIKVDGVDPSRNFVGIRPADYRNSMSHCEMVNCNIGTNGSQGNFAQFCIASNCVRGFNGMKSTFCIARNCSDYGFISYYDLEHCIAHDCATGFFIYNFADVYRCIADNCSANGIWHYGGSNNSIECLVTNCNRGIYHAAQAVNTRDVFFYNNVTDLQTGVNRYSSYDSTSITSDPYTDSANGDYTINNNETGGRPYRQLLENGESIARNFYPPSLPEKQDIYARYYQPLPLFEFSVGTDSSRDYSSLTACFAALNNTLVDKANSKVIITVYNDTGTDKWYCDTSTVTLNIPSNCIDFVLTVDDDSWHKGQYDKGCIIQLQSPSTTGCFNLATGNDNRILIERLAFDANNQIGSNTFLPSVFLSSNSSVNPGHVPIPPNSLKNLYIRGGDGTTVDNVRGLRGINTTARHFLVDSCIVENLVCSGSSSSQSGMGIAVYYRSQVRNCTVNNVDYQNGTGTNYGIYGATNYGNTENCIVTNIGAGAGSSECYLSSMINLSSCVADDTTGTIQSTASTEFVDHTNSDYRLKPGASAVGSGPTTKAQIEDITGNRRRSVVAHDAGAFNNISGYDYDYDVAVPTADPTGLTTVFPFRYLVEDDFDDGTGPVAHPLRGN